VYFCVRAHIDKQTKRIKNYYEIKQDETQLFSKKNKVPTTMGHYRGSAFLFFRARSRVGEMGQIADN
jgi:hypothetical protein